jgi:imidazolonepropionase-like amidohydrolase
VTILKRSCRRWLYASLAALVLSWSTAALRAGTPEVFAIRDARIVPVSGPALDKGTIVIARGLITAVGTSVTVPPEAWVIDGTGLTVYPGLIDAGTDLGLVSATPPAASGGAVGAPGPGVPRPAAGPAARGPEDRPASTPWVQAADELKADDRRFESWRSSGFTTALSAPRTGLLAGQGAVINLAGERPGDLVLRAPATLQVSLQPPGGFGSFPGSLMGTVAYIRQVFLDVEHDVAATRAYGAGSRGQERPAYDRTLRALEQAQAANVPVLVPAQTAVQIVRVLDLAKELKLKPVLVGAHQAYRVADRIAAAGTPVIVSLKWPEPDANADPEAVELLRSLRLRADAPTTPAVLESKGVTYAFTSDGVQPRDVIKHVRKAIDGGLASDAALRALTVNAARILGVADRLGTLEAGKIANLVVTDGDLFGEKTKVKMTFVDGAKFDVVEASKPAGGEKPSTSLTGRWVLTVSTPNGSQTPTADLVMADDGSLSGSLTSPMGTLTLASGSVSGQSFTFTVNTSMGGPTPVTLTFSGTVDGNTIKGTMSAGTFSGDFTGTRPGTGAGEGD